MTFPGDHHNVLASVFAALISSAIMFAVLVVLIERTSDRYTGTEARGHNAASEARFKEIEKRLDALEKR